MKTHLLLRSAASAIAASFPVAGFASIAAAAAPQLKTSAPGYYRMMLGDFEVTALSDGTVDLKMADLLTNIHHSKDSQRAGEAALERSGRDVGQRLPDQHRQQARADRRRRRGRSLGRRSAS